MTARRFPPPWSVEELDACFVARDHNGQQLAYVYFEDEPGRRSNNSSRVGGSDPQRESILIYRRNNSGSLATFIAIRRASCLVSSRPATSY